MMARAFALKIQQEMEKKIFTFIEGRRDGLTGGPGSLIVKHGYGYVRVPVRDDLTILHALPNTAI